MCARLVARHASKLQVYRMFIYFRLGGARRDLRDSVGGRTIAFEQASFAVYGPLEEPGLPNDFARDARNSGDGTMQLAGLCFVVLKERRIGASLIAVTEAIALPWKRACEGFSVRLTKIDL